MEAMKSCFICGCAGSNPLRLRGFLDDPLVRWNCYDEDGATQSPDGQINWNGIDVCVRCSEFLDERLNLKAHELKKEAELLDARAKLQACELKKEASFVESVVGKLTRWDKQPHYDGWKTFHEKRRARAVVEAEKLIKKVGTDIFKRLLFENDDALLEALRSELRHS